MELSEELQLKLQNLQPGSEKYAVNMVNELIAFGIEQRASDLHLIPLEGQSELSVNYRMNGVLESAGKVPGAVNIVTRLKVISSLLTYRTDVPQEGRIKEAQPGAEVRVSTFPTIHGEKVVVRFFIGSGEYRFLKDLIYSPEIEEELNRILQQTSGLLLTSGPAGSGKTTSLYAFLREIQRLSDSKRSICSIEDPVEAILSGVSQSLIKPDTEFTYQRALTSLMRQDPDVIMVGEIRDPETARIVFQASLTGHFVLSTFHAGDSSEALGRLFDMGIEPYVLRSGLSAIVAQRLLRRRCECTYEEKTGCLQCHQTGYRSRTIVAELLTINDEDLGTAILSQADKQTVAQLAEKAGMVPIMQAAKKLIEQKVTTVEECCRVFGTPFLTVNGIQGADLT